MNKLLLLVALLMAVLSGCGTEEGSTPPDVPAAIGGGSNVGGG